jgi:hypothetical protein
MAAHHPLSVPRLIAALLSTVTLAACVSTPETGPGAGPAVTTSDGRRIEDLVLVDCLLPGQVRQLGTRLTYLAPRRRVKTTKSDCGIRGGEFVLFDRSDYRTALQTLLPQARGGDAVAQTYVGEIYEKGLGLSGPDYGVAALWYRKAAAQGHRPAQTNLGFLYERGLGVAQNKAEALTWYRKASGIAEDPLVFESMLKAERATFQREIRLRNQVVSSLRKQLRQASASSRPQAASASGPSKTQLVQVETSHHREVDSRIEQVQREIGAAKTLKENEPSDQKEPSGAEAGKKAQIKKLELSLRRELEDLTASKQRLAGLDVEAPPL